ncbi:MAG: radical SAM family heme chaperone HemW [Deltaproteobacteria bacterium]|nr:radical SAM family heme chaperone HemW [Deltaproteobacteria bacterium]
MKELSSFAIYVHSPFCLKKCPYCDFNSIVSNNLKTDQEKFQQGLQKEIAFYSSLPFWKERACTSVYFGGGTPTALKTETIANILMTLNSNFTLANNAEITIETNPVTINCGVDYQTLRALGFNRLSIGAQSFSDKKLKQLGRLHNATDVISSYQSARKSGFENISLDLIFGTSEETLAQWKNDLIRAISLQPEHLSVYQLTYEDGSDLYNQLKTGEISALDDDLLATMYKSTQLILTEHGFEQYEISNYSLPDKESRHNLNYWARNDYLGLGPGAHSFSVNGNKTAPFGLRWANAKLLSAYLSATEKLGSAKFKEEVLSKTEVLTEIIFLGLRTINGVNLSAFEKIALTSFRQKFSTLIPSLVEQNLIVVHENSIAPTTRGFLFADYLAKEFVNSLG